MRKLAIVYHEGIADYDFGAGHPFRGDRFPKYMDLLKAKGLLDIKEVHLIEPRPAEDPDLTLVHTSDYMRQVELLARRHAPLSADTPLNPKIPAAARLIVGSAMKAAELVVDGDFGIAQGVGGGLHHAGRDYGGGFCVFNDVAVCAQAMLERKGLERIMIFDSDAHAGNGTMDIFYEEPRVLYVSTHQDPRTIYPGTGFTDQIGKGPGVGYTVNIPLPPGAGDDCMDLVLDRVFNPLAEQFKPQLIIRNGGTDPHFMDGLANLGLSFGGLRSIGEAVSRASGEARCGVVDLVCSGYNPTTVAEGWYALLSGEIEIELELPEDAPRTGADPRLLERTETVIRSLAKILSDHWSLA